MRIAWCTDIHLNFLAPEQYGDFLDKILAAMPDALFITGDIAEAPSLSTYMETMDSVLRAPIYFVLGNHDYYHGRISTVRAWAREVTGDGLTGLNWMSAAGVVSFGETAVVGVDGWGDGRLGNPVSSNVFLNDWLSIRELMHRNPMSQGTHIYKRIPLLNQLGDQEAEMLQEPLKQALETHSKVFVLTHVPPWKEATWHAGKHSSPDWLPWFSCQAVGDTILNLAGQYPKTEVTVLCGHTHGQGTSQIADNVVSITGGARYGHPAISQLFDV